MYRQRVLFADGSGWPRVTFYHRGVFIIYLLILMFVILPCYESRARNNPNIQLLSNSQAYKSRDNVPLYRYEEGDWKKEDHSVKLDEGLKVSIPIKKQIETVYVPEFPATNYTHNHTGDQYSIHKEESLTHKRFKRGVIHLYNMVVCATGCNPLAYKGYGCYCGFLGSGYVIDGIDKCCKMHDWCYDATECVMFSEYFVPYYWRCYHGYKPVCAVEHGNWGGSGSCAQRLCECDRSFAECLKRYPCPTTKAVCTSSPWRLVQNLFMIM